jgi:hypothetical protein
LHTFVASLSRCLPPLSAYSTHPKHRKPALVRNDDALVVGFQFFRLLKKYLHKHGGFLLYISPIPPRDGMLCSFFAQQTLLPSACSKQSSQTDGARASSVHRRCGRSTRHRMRLLSHSEGVLSCSLLDGQFPPLSRSNEDPDFFHSILLAPYHRQWLMPKTSMDLMLK